MKKVSRKSAKRGKSKTSANQPRKQIKKAKTYPAYLMGILLVALLLSESGLMLNAQASDWQAGMTVLDVSSGVASAVSDVKLAMQPAVDTVVALNYFFEESANVTTQLVDLSDSDSDPLMAVIGINNFYKIASQEMANVLDLSNYTTSWQPQVAGATITR